MKTPTLLAQLFAVAVLSAPLAVSAVSNEDTIRVLKLIRFVEPVFPAGAREDGVAEGTVTMAVNHNVAGEPVDVLVLYASYPAFGEAAAEAVRQWRFESNGQPDPAPKLLQLTFRLQGIVIFPSGKNLEADTASQMAASPAAATMAVPRLQALSQVPRALVQPMPQYPETMAKKQLTGTAAVSFYVDESGRVRLPEVVDATDPEFGAAAVAAVSQWRYEPPRINGRSTIARDHWEFKFQAVN